MENGKDGDRDTLENIRKVNFASYLILKPACIFSWHTIPEVRHTKNIFVPDLLNLKRVKMLRLRFSQKQKNLDKMDVVQFEAE